VNQIKVHFFPVNQCDDYSKCSMIVNSSWPVITWDTTYYKCISPEIFFNFDRLLYVVNLLVSFHLKFSKVNQIEAEIILI